MRAQSTDKTLRWIALGALALALGASACQEDFDPLEQVEGLRLLAFAPDKPALLPGEAVMMTALVAAPEGAELSYLWEWCPFSSGSTSGYECAFTQEELDGLLAQGPVPLEAPNLIFGAGPTAELPYPLPAPLLQGICAQLTSGEVPDFVELPDCQAAFPITLRLTVADNTGNSIVAVKTLDLLYGPPQGEDVNANPELTGLRIAPDGQPREMAVPLEPGVPFEVVRDEPYTIFLDVDPAQAQTYTPLPTDEIADPPPRLETLQAQWFFQGGSFENDQTIFIEDFVGFDILTENVFITPKTFDYPEADLNIYVLLRDNRGGLTWIERSLKLK